MDDTTVIKLQPATVREGVGYPDYSRLEAVNFSKLKFLKKSAAAYRHALIARAEDTTAKRMGRVRHIAALEPDGFQNRCALWTGLRRAGKKWDKFVADNDGRELLTQEEWDHCARVAKAVRDNAAASALLKGSRKEVTVDWTDPETGIRCKARLDCLGSHVADLKTCRDASPEGFARQAWKYAMHTQLAMYQEGVRVATGELKPVAIIAVEDVEPHVVQVYNVPERVLDVGREDFHNLLRALAVYRERDQWPGYSDDGSPLDLELPRWAVDPEDEDLTGSGLIFGAES